MPRGFTLIELMITVAILGIVASVAVAAYTDYVKTAQQGAMVSNFELAVATARKNYVAARQLRTMGASVGSVIPADSAGWVELLNSTAATAPGGGEAFEVGAGSVATGAIGVAFSGMYANLDSVVTITRPAFAGLPEGSALVAQLDF